LADRHFSWEDFGLGLLSGVILGLITGLLFAPQSGAEMRGKIASKASDIKISALELIDQARQSLEEAAHQVESLVGLRDKSIRKKLEEIKAQLEEFNLNET
jgi:gas vesicle protein